VTEDRGQKIGRLEGWKNYDFEWRMSDCGRLEGEIRKKGKVKSNK